MDLGSPDRERLRRLVEGNAQETNLCGYGSVFVIQQRHGFPDRILVPELFVSLGNRISDKRR
jgi:rRNA maturation protein Rpf1